MFPNGNAGLENSKFYEDVPARGHLIGRTATTCRKSALVTPAGHELQFPAAARLALMWGLFGQMLD